MAQVVKLPYYAFTGGKWKEYAGSQGCIPLNTLKCISFDRLAPGEPPPPKKTPEQAKQQAEKKQDKAPDNTPAKQAQQQAPQDAESVENPPTFDLLDIPIAMKNMGWPVSAKLADEWFRNPKHIYNDDPNSDQPIDSTTITLDWCLNFGSVQDKYNELLSKKIYNDAAKMLLKKKLTPILEKGFQSSINLNFDTTPYVSDLRKFHIDWQFQLANISNYDTLTSTLGMTDLTGALANFGIYAAIGRVEVRGDRYYKYNQVENTKSYCIDAQLKVTHVYLYVKDNYSFNDSVGNSQYLGHWNKKGVILTTGGLVSELVNGKRIHTNFGNSPNTQTTLHWNYLFEKPLDKPVDKRTGIIRKFKEQDVYWPVYNRTYSQWREQHGRGGDFMIYSKPKLMKLNVPIEIDMGTICRQAEKM
ncbi:hypothetical protein WL28_26180 [Burkholderia ubonensis]|uniref:DUF6402 family protein n=1 Tax=Burkholderia ubonensis TaxID=101571 RepID=UPI00075A347F|nr:DUF6402 family protein [Burkholderia ubonensis]KVO99247.1 hypothetical protein WJ81_29295 [Burkholderia ubonensis]KVZ55559.1 hypothetical protein WL20_25900 [Burkholderia ubonensis]KVZ68579.1 hypothetical protein WL21_00815 [Burkholderia ubonensis]KWA64418.1 hypothetical protein WL28_26180 [Burkholderia ubonensis]